MEKTQHGGEHKQIGITVVATKREVKRRKDTKRKTISILQWYTHGVAPHTKMIEQRSTVHNTD